MSQSKRTSVIGEVGVGTYCGPCLKRLNKGLRKNGLDVIASRPCLRGEHFPCFGCGELFDGAVIKGGSDD